MNFADCESFLESNSPDILALCETNLDDSTDSGNFSVTRYLPLIQKDSSTHMHGLAVYVKEGLPFAQDLSLENSADSYLYFQLALLHSVSYFFFLYQSPSSSLCTVFDSISSNIDEFLSINPSANVFVFGDFNVHHKDWRTYSGKTERSVITFLSQTTLLRWLTFGSLTVTRTVLLFWISFFLLMLVFVLENSDHVVVSLSIGFPSYSQLDAPFHHIVYYYSCTDWDDLRDHFRDVLWEDIFKGCVRYILLVCFFSLKESTCETRKNVFYFTSRVLFVLEKIKF